MVQKSLINLVSGERFVPQMLSIVVPVYNEAPIVDRVFEYFFSLDFGLPLQWIIVNDCSTDGTSEKLEKLKIRYPEKFTLIRNEVNMGKGSSIREGLKACKGNLIMIQDADFEYDPADVPGLLEPFYKEQADAVYGSRFKKSGQQVHRTYHYFINRFLTFLSNALSGIYLTDMETCYKVVRADLLGNMNLKSKAFEIEVEITAYLAKLRSRIFEVPIRYYPRNYLQGKKIRWNDGLWALYYLIKFNWGTSKTEAYRMIPSRFNFDGYKTVAPVDVESTL